MIKKYTLPTLLLTCIVILIAACSGFSSGKTLNTNLLHDDIVSGGKYSTSGDNAAAYTGEPSQSCLYWIRPK